MPDPQPTPDPQPQPAAPPPSPPPATTAAASSLDIQARIVNGILVVGVIGVVGLLYTYRPADAAMFGTFATLVGTALSAYFGISATREISRNAVDSSNQQAADAQQQVGELQAQHRAAANKLSMMSSVIGPGPNTGDSVDEKMMHLRTILTQ